MCHARDLCKKKNRYTSHKHRDKYFYRCSAVQQNFQWYEFPISSVQSLSRVWLCDPMDFSTPGLPIHHQLPEFTQTHVHWVGDATQLSHPLSSPFPPTFNLSHHQGLTPLVLTLSVITPARNFVSTSFPSPFRVQCQSNIFISKSYPVLHCGEHF